VIGVILLIQRGIDWGHEAPSLMPVFDREPREIGVSICSFGLR
jgi:hypothetical protein